MKPNQVTANGSLKKQSIKMLKLKPEN